MSDTPSNSQASSENPNFISDSTSTPQPFNPSTPQPPDASTPQQLNTSTAQNPPNGDQAEGVKPSEPIPPFSGAAFIKGVAVMVGSQLAVMGLGYLIAKNRAVS